jgi:hypothetical protein
VPACGHNTADENRADEDQRPSSWNHTVL